MVASDNPYIETSLGFSRLLVSVKSRGPRVAIGWYYEGTCDSAFTSVLTLGCAIKTQLTARQLGIACNHAAPLALCALHPFCTRARRLRLYHFGVTDV